MSQIVLTPEQLQVVAQSQEPVEVLDDQGRVLACIPPLSAEDLEDFEHFRQYRNRTDETGIPSERVQAFLRKLDEVDQREGIDEVKVQELLAARWPESRYESLHGRLVCSGHPPTRSDLASGNGPLSRERS